VTDSVKNEETTEERDRNEILSPSSRSIHTQNGRKRIRRHLVREGILVLSTRSRHDSIRLGLHS